jgi:putative aldouronate transport system permease protein
MAFGSRKAIVRIPRERVDFRGRFLKDRLLYIMLVIPLVHILIFSYLPMYGVSIAFQDYNVFSGFLNSKWVWFDNFIQVFKDDYFWKVFFNTLRIGTISTLISFPAPILLALLLNEVVNSTLKKFVQTLTYVPYFVSMVVICGMILQMLQPQTGILNIALKAILGRDVYFATESQWFIPVYVLSGIWQSTGFGAIIYLAALSNIDVEQYEAATIDGASRYQRAIYITIPGIMPTIIMMFILSMPGILSANFEKILLLYNPVLYDIADVVPTYVFRRGLMGLDFSYGTAVSFLFSLLSLFIIWGTNKVAKSYSDISLW